MRWAVLTARLPVLPGAPAGLCAWRLVSRRWTGTCKGRVRTVAEGVLYPGHVIKFAASGLAYVLAGVADW